MTTRAEMDEYVAELRDYKLRLCEWLGMDPSQVIELDEEKTGETGPLDPPGLRVTWKATSMQPVERGHLAGVSMSGSGDEDTPVVHGGAVELDFELLRQLRADVGERPEMPGLADAARAFGMQS